MAKNLMRIKLTPYKIMSWCVTGLLLLSIACIYLAVELPAFAGKLAVQNEQVVYHDPQRYPDSSPIITAISKDGQNWRLLVDADLVEEPDLLNEFDAYNRFFDRQSEFYQLLQSPKVFFKTSNGDPFEVNITKRHWTQLPGAFWTQLVVANIAMLFGVFLLAFRAKNAAVKHYFTIGFSLSVAIFAAAIYSTRPLALEGELFHTLSITNHFGGLMFSAGLLSLVWRYPSSMSNFRFPLYCYLIIFAWWILNSLQWFFTDFNGSIRLNALLALIIAAIFILIQWFRNRKDPVNRVAVRWFLVAVFTGATGFGAIVIIPQMLGQPPLASQGLAFVMFLSIYVALAVGVSRYKLFDLDRWSFEIGLWLAYGGAVIALDIAIVTVLNLTYQQATWIAIAIAGWIYFPVRQFLLRRLPMKYNASLESILPNFVSAVAGARNNQDIIKNIQTCFNDLFSPMKSQIVQAQQSDIEIAEDGLVLFIPLPENNGTIELSYPGHGQKLFNSQDIKTTKAITKLLEQAIAAHNAKLEGITMERNRIKQDMHDSLGGYLLAIIQQSTTSPIRQLGRYAWGELRDILSSLDNEDTVLSENVNRWRTILGKLIVEDKIALRFNVSDAVYDSPITLSGLQRLNLGQMLREALVNAYQHSQCSYIDITIELKQQLLTILVRHDGAEKPMEQWQKGRGMNHLQQRAEQLKGAVKWQTLDDNTVELLIEAPLKGNES